MKPYQTAQRWKRKNGYSLQNDSLKDDSLQDNSLQTTNMNRYE